MAVRKKRSGDPELMGFLAACSSSILWKCSLLSPKLRLLFGEFPLKLITSNLVCQESIDQILDPDLYGRYLLHILTIAMENKNSIKGKKYFPPQLAVLRYFFRP